MIAIDGIMKNTGGNRNNLIYLKNNITFIDKRIEDVENLPDLIQSVDLIICSMGWTPHQAAILDPFYDLELNIKSHLTLLNILIDFKNKKVIYLGSRSQYGNQNDKMIYEKTPMVPSDIQGINKLAAEYYYRVYSELFSFNAISIRFPACYGRNQMTEGQDIGLLGCLINQSLADNNIEIFGEDRKRNFIYVDDLTDIILKISEKNTTRSFVPLNIRGTSMGIDSLAKNIIAYSKKGRIIKKTMPDQIRSIEIGNSEMCDDNLVDLIGPIVYTDVDISLSRTIDYFKEKIYD